MQKLDNSFLEQLKENYSEVTSIDRLSHTELTICKHQLNDVAKSVLSSDYDPAVPVDELTWRFFESNDKTSFFMQPEQSDVLYRVKHPFAQKTVDNPADYDYLVTADVLGLFCTIIALGRMRVDLIKSVKERRANQNLVSKILPKNYRAAEASVLKIGGLIDNLHTDIESVFADMGKNPLLNRSDVEDVELNEQRFFTCAYNFV
ncbi:MAG: hypothetical protein VYA60_04345 [Pseudomonadota bacterium]|nr:hypothetical protein [Pseudomonadota bacterium]